MAPSDSQFEALSSWVQKVVDLVRDLSREVEVVRHDLRDAITDLRKESSVNRKEVIDKIDAAIVRLDALEKTAAQKAGIEVAKTAYEAKKWQVRLAVLAAILASLGNLFVWHQTHQLAVSAAASVEERSNGRK